MTSNFHIEYADGTYHDCAANSIEDAAVHAAQWHYSEPHLNDVTAVRTTGDPGLNGSFQAYRWDAKLNAQNSVGRPFRVSAR